MRNTMKAALLVCAIGLGSCSLLPAGGSTSNSPTIKDAEKALTIAHIAYNGIGQALQSAANNGLLHGNSAASAKVYFDKAADALLVADKADAALNAQGVFDAIAKAEDALISAKTFVKGN